MTEEKTLTIDPGRHLARLEPEAGTGRSYLWVNIKDPSSVAIPERHTKEREEFLRKAGKDVDLIAIAITVMCQKVASLDFVVTGPETQAVQWRDILVRFWTTEVQKFVREVCWSNKGGYAYIVVYAPSWAVDNQGDLTERGKQAIEDGRTAEWEVAYVETLDSRRCRPRDSLQHPVIYSPSRGAEVKLPESEFLHVIDSPIADVDHPGYGQCATDRCIEIALMRGDIVTYFREAFSDKPRAGIVLLNNVLLPDYEEARNVLETGQKAKGLTLYQGQLLLTSAETTQPMAVNEVPFRIAPEGWSQKDTYTESVQVVSAAFTHDTLEFGVLAAEGLGSGQQSTVMHKKSKGRLFALITQGLEREIKAKLLPESCEFEFTSQDVEETKEEAEAQAAQIGNIRSMWEADRTGERMVEGVEARQLLVDVGALPGQFIEEDVTDRVEVEDTEAAEQKALRERKVKAYSDGRVVVVSPPVLQKVEKKATTSNRDAVDAYTRRLRRIYESWAKEAATQLEETEEEEREAVLAGLLALLSSRLKAAGRQGLQDAFDRGLGDGLPQQAALARVQEVIAQNDAFIDELLLDTEERFWKDARTEGFQWEEAFLGVALGALSWRMERYGGVWWELGALGALQSIPTDVPHRWDLDPSPDVKHCVDCEEYEGEYEDYDQMLARTGGIPGGVGVSACDGNCRCSISALVEGAWVQIWP